MQQVNGCQNTNHEGICVRHPRQMGCAALRCGFHVVVP